MDGSNDSDHSTETSMESIRPSKGKEKLYLEKWKTIRLQKWNYIFRHGILFWALPIVSLDYLTQDQSSQDWRKLVFSLVWWSLAGLGYFYLQFKAQEKRFREVFPDHKD